MRHLYCARCARIVIADFWTMLEAETVPTFSRLRLTCSCGYRIKLDLSVGRQSASRRRPAAAERTEQRP